MTDVLQLTVIPKKDRRDYPKQRKPDGDPTKRNPFSLEATLRAIRRLWNVKGESRDPVGFAPVLRDHLRNIAELYGHNSSDVTKELTSLIEKVESDNADLTYYYLRSYADLVGVSTSLLVLHSYLIGDIARGQNSEELDRLLAKHLSAIEHARALLASSNDLQGELVDYKNESDKSGPYNAGIGLLAALKRGYDAV